MASSPIARPPTATDDRSPSGVGLPVPYDGQELELLVALRAGSGGVDEKRLRLVDVEEDLAVEFEHAQLGVADPLGFAARDADLMRAPQGRELLALLQERADDLPGAESAPWRE